MADFSLQALKAEIDNDPEGIGYAPHVTAGRMGELGRYSRQISAYRLPKSRRP